MPLKREQRVVAHHTAAVVGDLDESLTASFHLKLDPGRARVQRVLEQLFYDRRRALHNFAGGDLVRNSFGKDVDFPHGSVSSISDRATVLVKTCESRVADEERSRAGPRGTIMPHCFQFLVSQCEFAGVFDLLQRGHDIEVRSRREIA